MLISYKPIGFNKSIFRSSTIQNNSISFIQPKSIDFGLHTKLYTIKNNGVDNILEALPKPLNTLMDLPHDSVICIFQGTLDPIHYSHLGIIQQAEVLMQKLIKEKQISKYFIVIIPSPRSKRNVSPLEDRVNMIRLAIAEMGENIKVCVPPLNKEHDTILEKVMQIALPNYQDRLNNIYFLRGTDSLIRLLNDQRKEPFTYQYIHHTRPGVKTEKLDEILRQVAIEPITLKCPLPLISSTDLRETIRKNGIQSARSMTTQLVLDYIDKHKIYSKRVNNLWTAIKISLADLRYILQK